MKLQTIIKKWYIILICAVLCAGGLYLEKGRVNTIVPQTGDMTYIRVVKFNIVPSITINQTSEEIDLTNLMKAWSNQINLESQLESAYDMDKMNPKWDTTAESQKMDWLGTHFRIQNMGPGLYELIIQFSKQDAKDSNYIKDNNQLLMDTYETYFLKTARMVTDDTKVSTIKEVQYLDEPNVVPIATIQKKYAVIGLILGILLGVVIVMILDARTEKRSR